MIRIATEDDMPRILEIEREAISPPWTHGGLLSEIYNEDSFFAVWDAQTATAPQILGFVILRRAADEGELFQIAVEAAHRRSGVADALMEAALDWARGCGISKTFLEVRKSNAAAISLYAKHGFKEMSLRKEYYDEPVEDAVIFVRN